MQGMTLKQMAAQQFYDALDAYREALKSKDQHRIVVASIRAHAARRNNSDRAILNRAFKESNA